MNAIWSFRRQLLSCFVSRRSFSKGWTTITPQKLLFFFCSLSFYFSHKRRKKQNMNATKWLWILFFNKFRKKKNQLFFFSFFCWFFGERFFFSALLHSERYGYTHGPDSKPLSKTSGVDTSSHTLSYKTPRWYRWVLSRNTACFTFCTEKPSTLFLLINNNSEWFKWQSMWNDSEIQHNTTLVTA